MPSIIPGYVYSLFAALIVCTIIISSVSVSMASIKNTADQQQLTNINRYVAAQSMALLSHATQTRENITQVLDVPSQIGNQRFWLCIANDSSGAWVQSGFGINVTEGQPCFSIPAQIDAQGQFVSGSGRAVLQCCSVDETVTLTLTCV
jgi:hypothetical protein